MIRDFFAIFKAILINFCGSYVTFSTLATRPTLCVTTCEIGNATSPALCVTVATIQRGIVVKTLAGAKKNMRKKMHAAGACYGSSKLL